MELSPRRLKDIEEHLSKDYDLLKKCEDALRLESDPRQQAKLEHQISELKGQIRSREVELGGVPSEQSFDDTKLPSIRPGGDARTSERSGGEELQLIVFHSPAHAFASSQSEGRQVIPITLVGDLLRTHLPPSPPADFTGRSDEIDGLVNTGENAVMVAITGVLGIGKTALLQAAAARLEAVPLFWHEFTPGFTTLDDVLTRLGRYLDSISGRTTFNRLINAPELSANDKVSLLIGEMNRVGCYLFFDRVDLVEGNAPLESFFGALKGRLKKGKVYLASRSKPGFITPLDEAKLVARVIPLTGLTEVEVVEYFRSRGITLSIEGAEKLDRSFEGMPLALELLTALAGEADGEAQLLAQADAVREKVIEQLFEELYTRLSPIDRELLTAASLLKFPFRKSRLLGAHQFLFGGNAAGSFVTLRRRSCLTPASEPDYYQVHEVVCAAALANTDKDLKALRGSLAEHLLADSPDDYIANLEALLLYKDAEDWDRAAEVAGELIYRRFVPYELERAETVLSIFKEQSLSRERWMWLLGDKGLVAHHSRQYAEAEERYSEMLELARELGSKYGEALALQRLGVLANDLDNDVRSEEFYRQCLALKEELGDEEGQAQIHNNLGSIYSSRGDFPKAAAELERGLELRRRIESPEWLYIELYSNLGILYARQEQWAEAFKYSNEALRVSEELGSPYDIAKSNFNLGKHEHERGNVEAAREKFLGVQETADRYELDELQELAYIALGRLCGDAGDFDQAITYFMLVAGIYERFQQRSKLAAIHFDIGTFYLRKDDRQSALDWYLKGIGLFEHFGEERQIELYLNNIHVMADKLRGQTGIRELVRAIKNLKTRLAARGASFALASVYGALGDIYIDVLERGRAATACFRREIALLDELGRERELVTAQINLGAVFERAGRYPDALSITGEALKEAREHNLSDIVGIILYNRGNCYAELELYAQAEASYREAEMHGPDSGHDHFLQMVRHNLGEVFRRQGRLDEAVELLASVLSQEREKNDPGGIVHTLNNLGLAYDEMEREAEALSCWHEAVSICRLHSLKRDEANTLISVGNFCLVRDRPGEAKGYYEKALSAARAADDAVMEEGCVLSLAQAHRELGTFESFEEEFKRAAERADKLGHYENLIKFLTMAGEVNLDEGEAETAAEMFEQALVFAFWRVMETIRQFADAEERPDTTDQVAYVIGRIIENVESCVNGDKAEAARGTLQSLVDRLKRKDYFGNIEFPINFLTFAIDYVEIKPVAPIRKYIIDRIDAEKNLEDPE
ncbi:MAG TPA: tetratricopeptide repeat protein [Pyrinomonadaceae bacterium]